MSWKLELLTLLHGTVIFVFAVSCRYNENGYVEDVEVNFIVWEIHGRDDYSFNTTMKKVHHFGVK